MTSDLSVIIVNYNCAADTVACVAALQANHGCAYEIIVVDNDSEPEDRRLLETLDGVSLVYEPAQPAARARSWGRRSGDGGFATGCNRGAERARGTYLLFVNPDVLVRSPTTLAELVAAADAAPDLGALGCRILFDDDRPQPSAHRRYPGLATHAWDYAPIVSSLVSRIGPRYSPSFFPLERYATDVLSATHLLGAFLLVPRAVFHRAGGFDESFFLYREETDLCQRIAALDLKIVYVPTPVVVHRSGASTENHFFANLDSRYMQSTYRYLRLHHSAVYVQTAWLLAVVGMTLSLPYAHALRALKRITGPPPPDLDVLVSRLPEAIAWHLRHRRTVHRAARRRLPPLADP
jgi:GT2 family glycosyltransferase